MKHLYLVTLVLAILSSSSFANRKAFKLIATEAQLGNGDAQIEKYDTSLEKKALIARGLKDLKAAYWKNCGPWKTFTTRRTAIKKIDTIESSQDRTAVVKTLEALYESDEIVAIVGAESNNEIECSLSWFNIYGADGSVLELRYNMGD
jgi:hypothetical protein